MKRNKTICLITLFLFLFVFQLPVSAFPRWWMHRPWGGWAPQGPSRGDGGVVIKYSRFPNLGAINSQLASDGYQALSTNKMLMLGGIGRGIYEDNFILGYEGHVGALSNRGNVFSLDTAGDQSALALAYGSLKMGKLFGFSSDLYLFAGGSVGAGGLVLAEGTERKINRYLLILEPEIGIFFRMTSFFGIALTGSYLKSIGLGYNMVGNFPESFVNQLSLDNWTANVSFLWGGF